MGGQFRVEDQLLGQVASALLPELDEAEYLVVLLVLDANRHWHSRTRGFGILGQESQDPLLLAAPLGNIVFFDQRVLPVKGDRMEVQVEGISPRNPEPLTASNQVRISFGIAAGSMRQLYSVRKERLGTTFSPANKASPSSSTALMTWLWRAVPKSFSPKRRSHGTGAAGTIFEPGKPTWPAPDRRSWPANRQEQEQAAELGLDLPRCQVELADVSDIGHDGACAGRTFIIESAWERGQTPPL